MFKTRRWFHLSRNGKNFPDSMLKTILEHTKIYAPKNLPEGSHRPWRDKAVPKMTLFLVILLHIATHQESSTED